MNPGAGACRVNRRALLSTGVTLATAGCLGPVFGVGADCPRSAHLRLRHVTDAAVAEASADSPETLAPPLRDAVRAAHRGEDATLWLPGSAGPPFAGVDYLALDGDGGRAANGGDAFVAVSSSVVSAVERTGYAFAVETAEEGDGGGVPFADLPAVDRTALYLALGYGTFRKLRGSESVRSVSVGVELAYPDDESEARSALVPHPDSDVVRIEGHPLRFRRTDTTRATVETHRVDVRTVATTVGAFAAAVYERFGVDLDAPELSAAQHDVVQTAIADGYEECAPYSEAYVDLQERLGGSEPRPHRVDYANYDGEWYAVGLQEGVV
jgi:hypothetical protein